MQLEKMLADRGIRCEVHHHPTAYTSQRLAQVEHVSGYDVAKPVIVKGDRGFVMCVLPAPKHVDLDRVADALGDNHVRMATEAEMEQLFPDCELGAEPPIGALFGMPTIMDPALRDDEYLVMQAGTHTDAVRLRREDWERLCAPQVAAITHD